MSSFVPSSALNNFGIILTGISFKAFDIYSTVIDDALSSILPLDVNI
jgi:hypothetical protein